MANDNDDFQKTVSGLGRDKLIEILKIQNETNLDLLNSIQVQSKHLDLVETRLRELEHRFLKLEPLIMELIRQNAH